MSTPITRAAGIAVVPNPLAGTFARDLQQLFETGREAGEQLAQRLVSEFDRPVVSYGKAALVGTRGEMGHGGACIHPMLGNPMRRAVDGGKPVIPSAVKIAPPGSSIDVPLGYKDEGWSFDYFDTMTVFWLTHQDLTRSPFSLHSQTVDDPYPDAGVGRCSAHSSKDSVTFSRIVLSHHSDRVSLPDLRPMLIVGTARLCRYRWAAFSGCVHMFTDDLGDHVPVRQRHHMSGADSGSTGSPPPRASMSDEELVLSRPLRKLPRMIQNMCVASSDESSD